MTVWPDDEGLDLAEPGWSPPCEGCGEAEGLKECVGCGDRLCLECWGDGERFCADCSGTGEARPVVEVEVGEGYL